MATTEDKAAVRAVCEALKSLNASLDCCSELNIRIDITNAEQIVGRLNSHWCLEESVRVVQERILP